MHALIVEADTALSALWAAAIERMGHRVTSVTTEDEAIRCLRTDSVDVMILDLNLETGSALAIGDFAGCYSPDTQIISVTSQTFFSDGSIFGVLPNTRAFVRTGTPPEDLAAMADHYGGGAPR